MVERNNIIIKNCLHFFKEIRLKRKVKMSDSSVEPVTNSTDDSSTPDYNQLWQEELNELNDPSISASSKLETFFTHGVGILMGFYEQQMSDCANLMNSLSTMEGDLSQIQADFNQGQQYEQESDEQDYEQVVKQAMDLANSIQTTVDSNPAFASIADDVNTQMKILFPDGTDSSDSTAVIENTKAWYYSWYYTDNPTSTNNTTYDLDMTSVTDAFNALNSDFSGLSSEFQSQLQFYEGEDQQMQGLEEDGLQEWAKQENTMQSNQITN